MIEGGTDLIRTRNLKIEKKDDGLVVDFDDANGTEKEMAVDMVVLAPAIVPRADTRHLAQILGLTVDEQGFFTEGGVSPVGSSKEGIYVVGCAQGPKSIEDSVAEAYAAVAEILSPHQDSEVRQ
jgi:heterodisulfide reductase subunit A